MSDPEYHPSLKIMIHHVFLLLLHFIARRSQDQSKQEATIATKIFLGTKSKELVNFFSLGLPRMRQPVSYMDKRQRKNALSLEEVKLTSHLQTQIDARLCFQEQHVICGHFCAAPFDLGHWGD